MGAKHFGICPEVRVNAANQRWEDIQHQSESTALTLAQLRAENRRNEYLTQDVLLQQATHILQSPELHGRLFRHR
jgi:hypothetical protein